jgi:hypothetical protein
MRLDSLLRVQGLAFDVVLIGVAAAVAEDKVQAWLFDHPEPLYHGLVALHLITLPALLVAIIVGYGQAGRPEELQRQGPGLLGWATVFLLCGSFVIPGVLGLIFRTSMGEMLAAVFGPLAIFVVWMWALLMAEKRGYLPPGKIGEKKPFVLVQALAFLSWAYLLWLETMLISAAPHKGPIVTVGLPLGVLIDYLPIRIALYYIRDQVPRWEIVTMALSTVHLLVRIAAA